MGLFVRKAQPNTIQAEDRAEVAPVVRALEFLEAAAAVEPDSDALVIEERAVWQPDSWLLQRCWHELAEAGAGAEALQVATLLEARNPLARVQALYQVARRAAVGRDAAAARLVAQEVRQTSVALFADAAAETVFKFGEQLLYASAAAAQVGNISLACACLERLDQINHSWDRVFIPLEARQVLAETVTRIGLHPLTNHLLEMAIRRYEEPGAQFLHQIMELSAARLQEFPAARELQTRLIQRRVRRLGRLMQRCVAVFQFSTLSTLTARRLAATAFGQAGYVRDVLEQVETIANVQAARQETGLGSSRSDPHFLRQVKRPTANLDVDFQLYTLQEAIKVMPLRNLAREERIGLADRVAALATQSDGWTAAGAVATLVDLGALRYAVSVMDFIAPTDPTRSEGVISLVRALLAFGEEQLAHEQVQKAIVWARSLPGRNPERALIWGLAEVYMEYGQPQRAIELLDLRVARAAAEAGLGQRMRRLFRNAPNDDELRDNRLRLRALILQDRPPASDAASVAASEVEAEAAGDPDTAAGADVPAPSYWDPAAVWTHEKESIYRQLCQWAPRLLDGEALINFYVDGLLRPLFLAGQTDLIIQLLPQIRDALHLSTGDKHTVHIRKIALLLAQVVAPATGIPDTGISGPGATVDLPAYPAETYATLRQAFADFLLDLWAADAPRGVWQIVHSLEGSLPLLLALEGPHALVTIAHHTAEAGQKWSVNA
ncbi:MAG: hypothetical protein WDZ49_01000 [Litorilinea sp.]